MAIRLRYHDGQDDHEVEQEQKNGGYDSDFKGVLAGLGVLVLRWAE